MIAIGSRSSAATSFNQAARPCATSLFGPNLASLARASSVLSPRAPGGSTVGSLMAGSNVSARSLRRALEVPADEAGVLRRRQRAVHHHVQRRGQLRHRFEWKRIELSVGGVRDAPFGATAVQS